MVLREVGRLRDVSPRLPECNCSVRPDLRRRRDKPHKDIQPTRRQSKRGVLLRAAHLCGGPHEARPARPKPTSCRGPQPSQSGGSRPCYTGCTTHDSSQPLPPSQPEAAATGKQATTPRAHTSASTHTPGVKYKGEGHHTHIPHTRTASATHHVTHTGAGYRPGTHTPRPTHTGERARTQA